MSTLSGALDTSTAYVLADETSDVVTFINDTGKDLVVTLNGVQPPTTISPGASPNNQAAFTLGTCKWQWYVSLYVDGDPQMVFKRPPNYLAS